MAIGSIIQSVRKIMRKDPGVDGDAQRISQLVWMIFLKVFDAMEEEKEAKESNYKSPLPEDIRWRNWASNEEGITGEELLEFINEKLFQRITELEVNEGDRKALIIKQVFEDTYNYMKNGVLIRQVINEINKIDFTRSEDRHLFNDIYETILKELQSAGSAGEFYTPRAVTQFVVDMVNPKLGEIVLDPACGTGGFLISSLENIKKEVSNLEDLEKLTKNIKGVEKKPLPHLLCMTNLILHDVEEPSIKHDNSLAKPLRDYSSKEMVDVIVTNPPFGGAEEDGIEKNFPSNLQTRETADLFLVLIMKLLRDEGRCGLVLPDSFLSSTDGIKKRIKEKLFAEFNLHTIVRLPSGVFSPYTDIETNLLFFEKGTQTKEVWYFAHPLPEDYKKYTKTKFIKSSEFNLEKDWWNDRENEKFKSYAWKVSIKEILNGNCNLDLKNPNAPEDLELIKKGELIENVENNILEAKDLIENLKKNEMKEKLIWNELEIGNFLEERKERYKPEEANSLGLKRLNKIDFSGKIHLVEKPTNTNMILIKKGDLVISGINVEKGALSLYKGEEDLLATIHYSSYSLDESKIDFEFLRYYLKSKIFKDILSSQIKGGIKTEIKPSKFLPLKIKIPDLDSQVKIRNFLKMSEELSEKIGQINIESGYMGNSILNELYS